MVSYSDTMIIQLSKYLVLQQFLNLAYMYFSLRNLYFLTLFN